MFGISDNTLDAPAAAVECIHAYSLIHDDLPAMDDDDLRRGQPTCHIKFGEANAILAGDALQTLAFSILSDAPMAEVADRDRLAMISELAMASGVAGMCGGQALDLEAEGRQVNLEQLERISKAAAITGEVAALHLKIDTGLGRNGSTEAKWSELLEAVKALGAAVRVVGIFTHLSSTNRDEDLSQIVRFDSAVAEAKRLGVQFELRHLTASDGSLAYPEAHYEMVRIGVALYGLDPFSTNRSAEYGLIPAMTAISRVAQVKTVPAGHGVSYNFLHRTKSETNLALIPIGYAEGLPRAASGKAEVSIGGKRYPILSQVAMDQFVLDVGNDPIQTDDEVILFGDAALGVPSADDLAAACGTINYEIVTRMGGRFKREYVGDAQ
jgi:alanine racemase